MLDEPIAILITGPMISVGRTGLSFGIDHRQVWEIQEWNCENTINQNVSAATQFGASCFYAHWKLSLIHI